MSKITPKSYVIIRLNDPFFEQNFDRYWKLQHRYLNDKIIFIKQCGLMGAKGLSFSYKIVSFDFFGLPSQILQFPSEQEWESESESCF